MNPHLFTHLFHEGVIVSTRKLVYDAGSNEDSIKHLMQAQHKAVMKDLKRGAFDDKIDAYLSNVEGLEPRTSAGPKAAAAVEPGPLPVEAGPLEITSDNLSEPIELPLKGSRAATGDRTRPIQMDSGPPLPPQDNVPTLVGDKAAELAAAFQATQDRIRAEEPAKARTSTAQQVSRAGVAGARHELEIIDDDNDEGSHRRQPRDTTVEYSHEIADGIPARTKSEDVAMTTPVRVDRPASHGAASLPAVQSPSRPSAAPRVQTQERRRHPEDSVAEIHQAAPPSVEPPPGERGDRGGQYSVSRKSGEPPMREKTGRIAAINPNVAGQPTQQRPSGPSRVPQNVSRELSPRGSQPQPAISRAPTPPLRSGTQPAMAGRVGGPQQVRTHVTAPIQNRSPQGPATPQPGSGVVMTRPAVIVGGQPKAQTQQPPSTPSSTTSQRIRKAREDEGRGFGQGLISEKSLDEVILAYLSEDAEDK